MGSLFLWGAYDNLKFRKVVYKELVVEFLAMISFAREDGILVEDNLSFCLGGEKAYFKPC